jgi:hypothetical protein
MGKVETRGRMDRFDETPCFVPEKKKNRSLALAPAFVAADLI